MVVPSRECGGWDVDVSAGCGAREQEALRRGGTQDAAVQVGEDKREVGGAEAGRDGGESGGGRALADGAEEVATVAEQDADGVKDEDDVLGHGASGVILWRIGGGEAEPGVLNTSASMVVIVDDIH